MSHSDDYQVQAMYRRNLGGSKLIEVDDAHIVPDRCYSGCRFYDLRRDGIDYFAKWRADKAVESREIKLIERAQWIPRVIHQLDYDVRYGIIFPHLTGYLRLPDVDWSDIDDDDIEQFYLDYMNTKTDLNQANILRQIDMHPGNIMVLTNGTRLEDWCVIDLEPIGCHRDWETTQMVRDIWKTRHTTSA